MFQSLVSRNDDLARLVRRGYAVCFDSNHLVVRDIPYLDERGELQVGALVAKLEFIDQEHVKQTDHQVYFAGGVPHGLDGRPISNLGGGPCRLPLSDACPDVVVERSFSNKPRSTGRYEDFYHKIETYTNIISGPAVEQYPDRAKILTFRVVERIDPDPIFKFHDTLTSRANIGDLVSVFKDDIVAVVGLGGTGAYVLDLLSKTRVREIRGFDADEYHVHTAYRSPGKLEPNELGRSKADVYQRRYESFRYGITAKTLRIDESSEADLAGVTFAFVCVDTGSSRRAIFELLIRLRIPFIDVGMGLKRKHGPLSGMVRATYYAPDAAAKLRDMGLAELNDHDDDEYRDNVQIAELNALNACLAVIKFKQVRGFYHQSESISHAIFGVEDLSLIRDSH